MFKQDLFWKNISKSGKLIDKLGILRQHLKNKSFLNYEENAFFFYTGTGYIEKLDSIVLDKSTIARLNKKGLKFYLFEPVSLKRKGEQYTNGYYSEFKYTDLDNIEAEELLSISNFVIKNNLTNITVLTCDYNISKFKDHYPLLNLICYDSFVRVNAIHARNNGVDHNSIKTKFFCSNWRYTPHRHLTMSYLSTLQGNFSWHFKTSFENSFPSINWFNISDMPNNLKSILEIGASRLNELDFSLDNALHKFQVNDLSLAWPSDHRGFSDLYYTKYKECFCSIITETRFAYPFGNFSEKTLMAIGFNLPFVLVGPPHTIKYLNDLGFKTFNDWWDESYDYEENHQERLVKIFKVIEYINSKTLDELSSIYESMKPTLNHNFEILKTFSTNKITLL
jgi:hypothetical protein